MNEPELKLFVYQTSKDERWIYAHFQDGTVWLTLEQIADLFNSPSEDVLGSIETFYTDKDFNEGEVSKNFSISDYKNFCKSEEGKEQRYYNLDVILAIGYQENVKTATKFRQWSSGEVQNIRISESTQRVFHIYLFQIVFKFLVAIVIAYFAGLVIGKLAGLSDNLTYIVMVLTFLIAMYDTVFDAMRYMINSGIWKFKSKSDKN